MVVATTSLPHQDGGLMLLRVKAKKMTRVLSARPRSSPELVKKLSRLHQRK